QKARGWIQLRDGAGRAREPTRNTRVILRRQAEGRSRVRAVPALEARAEFCSSLLGPGLPHRNR
ncbi:MAG: hypothetical protein AAGF12_39025, partial [Myxococcota bacterium]